MGPAKKAVDVCMKSNLLVRPNLKMFLVAALLIAVLQDLISNGQSNTSILTAWAAPKNIGSEKELQQLLAKAEQEPSTEVYVRLSNCFERRGDFKSARLYLRRAEALSELEE
jgi:hypothetical protein